MKKMLKSLSLFVVLTLLFLGLNKNVYAKKIDAIRYGGSDFDSFNDIIVDGNEIVAVGSTSSKDIKGLNNASDKYVGLIVKYSNKKVVWQTIKTNDEGSSLHFNSIIKANNGYLVIAEQPSSYLYKYDNNGKLLWEKKADGTYVKIIDSGDGNYIIVGNKKVSSENVPFILKIDNDGNILKRTEFTSSEDEGTYDDYTTSNVVRNSNGDYAITLSARAGFAGIVCVDNNLNKKWENLELATTVNPQISDIAVNKLGNYVLVGYNHEMSTPSSLSSKDDDFGYILEIDSSNGELLSTIKAQNSDGSMKYPISRFRSIISYKDYYLVFGEAGDVENLDATSFWQLPKKLFLFSAVDKENVKKGQLIEVQDVSDYIADFLVVTKFKLINVGDNEIYMSYIFDGEKDMFGTKALGGSSDAAILHISDVFDSIKKDDSKTDDNKGEVVDVPDTLSNTSVAVIIGGSALVLLGVATYFFTTKKNSI